MRHVLFFIFVVMLSSSIAFANPFCDYFDEQNVVIGSEIPSFIPYGNEVFVFSNSSGYIGVIEVSDSIITTVTCDESDSIPTYSVTVSSLDTVKEIFDSSNPAKTFNDKIKQKELVVKGESFTKGVKWFFTRVGLTISSWFM